MTDHWDHHDYDHDDPGHVLPEPGHVTDPDLGLDALDEPEHWHTEPEQPGGPEPDDAPAPVEEHAAPVDDVFPPQIDVGELPEPVDGFPWIDAGTLGAAGAGWTPPVQSVEAAELADYAATDATTWPELADSEDPATAALARFWSPGTP